MKMLDAARIREIDAKTVEYDSISSIDLMEQAATAFTEWFIAEGLNRNERLAVVCGTGNNGGDGLAVARMLHEAGTNVVVWMLQGKRLSADCETNLHRAQSAGITIKMLSEANEDNIDLSEADAIIDAIFGTGFDRELSPYTAKIIRCINDSAKPIFSIDVPSGLFADRKTEVAVQASRTATFQIPKPALFYPDNYRFTGLVSILNIGLSQRAIDEAETNIYFTTKEDVGALLKPLSKFAHKGTQGHAVIIGGSVGRCGSVCLASKAALKSGCGLVTAFMPACGVPVIQSYFPEAMAIGDRHEERLTSIEYDVRADAVGIGVGLGLHQETQKAFRNFIQRNKAAMVVDADGLNIISENRDMAALLPPKTILTPHPKELERLIGKWSDDFEKVEKVQAFAQKHDLVVVVKGAYSLVVDSLHIYMNSTGTPALATAGSGDVLTGIITGLLAQGYMAVDAARIGVFIHGLTAELSARKTHPASFIASDIIENMGNAFFVVEESRRAI